MKRAHLYLSLALLPIASVTGFLLVRSSEKTPGEPPIAATSPVVPAPAPPEDPQSLIRRIARDLGSADPARAAQARSELTALPYQNRNWLRRQTDATLDPETKTLLAARLAEMEEHLALHPLPVTLHLKDATLAEIVSQLNTDFGTSMEASTLGAGHFRYTLDADELSFWDVMLRLHRQNPIRLSDTADTLTTQFYLLDHGPGMSDAGPDQPVIQGSFCLYARWVYSQNTKPTAAERLRLGLMFATDPRLHVIQEEQTVDRIVDDAGNILYTPPAPQTSPAGLRLAEFHRNTCANQFLSSLQLTAGPKPATRIPSIKFHAHIVVSAGEESTTIEDLQTKTNQSIQLGATSVTITNFTLTKQTMMTFSSTSSTILPYVRYELFDSTHYPLSRWTWSGTSTRGSSAGKGGPFTLLLAAPQRLQEMTIDLELRNVPLPP